MSTNEITTKHLIVWIISSMIGAIVFCADGNWIGTLIGGSVVSLLVWLSLRLGDHWNGSVYRIVQCIWLSVVLSQLLGYSADCWPTGERTFPVVPLSLLTLATISAHKGSECTAKGVCVLFWIMAGLLGIVVISGIPELNLAFLEPRNALVKPQILFLYLLPSLTGFFKYKIKSVYPFGVLIVFGVCISVWICGILSQQIANVAVWPFYESAKSVQFLNIAKRLESLVSAGVTIGNYALYSLLLCAAGNIGERFGKRRAAVNLSSVTAAGFMLLNVKIDDSFLIIASGFLWVFLPLLGAFKRKVRK